MGNKVWILRATAERFKSQKRTQSRAMNWSSRRGINGEDNE